MIEWLVGILFILKLNFAIRVGEENHLTRRVYPATEELVRFEDHFRIEVSHAAAAPVQSVVPREVSHEATEVFNPGIMLISVEQVERPPKRLLRCIEWVTHLTLVVKE